MDFQMSTYVHPRFEDQDKRRVLAIHCEKGPKPAFVKDGNLPMTC
jgi:hypothetical protein